MVYTRDFRMHDPLLNMTQEFIHEIKMNDCYLSINGLNQEQKNIISEGIKD